MYAPHYKKGGVHTSSLPIFLEIRSHHDFYREESYVPIRQCESLLFSVAADRHPRTRPPCRSGDGFL